MGNNIIRFRVSDTIGVSGFSRLRYYRDERHIVAMEQKELNHIDFSYDILLNFVYGFSW